MLIYILLIFIAVVLLVNNKFSTKNAIVLMVFMLIICGLRDYSIGIDTESYVDKYRFNYNDYTSEFLFNATYSLIRFIGGSGHLWLLFVSVLLYIPYMIAIGRYSVAPVLSAFIFLASPTLFFFDSMNGIRQWIAGGLILLSFLYRSEQQISRCVLCFLLALGFHMSSIVALPFMFIWKRTIPYKIVVLSLFLITILSLTMTHFNLSAVFERYMVLLDALPLSDESKFSQYAQYGELENTTNWKYYIINIVPINLMCLASYPNVTKSIKLSGYSEKNEDGYLFNVFFMGTLLMNVCSISIMYGHRVFFALMTLQLILLPRQFVNGTKKQRLLIFFLLLYLIVWFLYYVISTNGYRIGSTVPHTFFFS